MNLANRLFDTAYQIAKGEASLRVIDAEIVDSYRKRYWELDELPSRRTRISEEGQVDRPVYQIPSEGPSLVLVQIRRRPPRPRTCSQVGGVRLWLRIRHCSSPCMLRT